MIRKDKILLLSTFVESRRVAQIVHKFRKKFEQPFVVIDVHFLHRIQKSLNFVVRFFFGADMRIAKRLHNHVGGFRGEIFV